MVQLDETLDVNMFYCNTHQKTICCVCAVECHKNCQIEKYNEKENEILLCLCNSEKHTIYNELALTFNLEKYQELSGVRIWPIQALNILFNHKNTFEKMSNLFNIVLKNINNKENEVSKDKLDRFFSLLKLFSSKFLYKYKTYYYHDDLLEMCEFETLVKFINDFDPEDRNSMFIKIRIILLLMNLHIKRDFNMVINLTSVDFLNDYTLERIVYKKILSKPNIYTNLTNRKYNLSNLSSENNIIKKILTTQLFEILEKSSKLLTFNENANEFLIILKFTSCLLKKIIFTKDELIKLIKALYKFYNNYFDYVKNDDNNLFNTVDIFTSIIEIIFILSINYNDISIMEYLDTNDSLKLKDFIHVKSEYGGMLLKMTLRNCEIVQKHYKLIENSEGEHPLFGTEKVTKKNKKRKVNSKKNA